MCVPGCYTITKSFALVCACVYVRACDFVVQKCVFVFTFCVCAALPTHRCGNEKTMSEMFFELVSNKLPFS